MIKPMLAETAREPFDHKDWLFELKLDGVRAIAVLNKGNTKLIGRSGSDITYKFLELAQVHRQTSKSCILDGEIVSSTHKFVDIQQRIHKENALAIRIASKEYPVIYYAFDMLYLDGQNLMHYPLLERKVKLHSQFIGDCSARTLGFETGSGIALFNKVKALGLEGIMAKQIQSPYLEGKRSKSWLKVKAFCEDTFQIYGLTRGDNARSDTFASLILGKDDRFVGCVGTGFDDLTLKLLLSKLHTLKSDKCQLQGMVLDREVLFFTEPKLCCEVRYLAYGSEGHLRFPSFRRLV